MSATRYDELLGRLLEGEPLGADAEELARELSASGARRQDLRRHLVLWEIWSQQQAPERSAEAFVRAWRTRLRAETECADVFPDAVRARLEARQSRPGIIESFREFLTVRRRAGLAWVASLLILSLLCVFWFAVPRSAHAITTLEGEAVCTACVLHESHDHAPAIRVIAGGVTNTYYLDRNAAVAGLQDYFCGGPTPATAEGRARMEASRRRFEAETVTIPAANKTPDTTTNAVRVIFPI